MRASLVGPGGPLLTRRRLLASLLAGTGTLTMIGSVSACSAGGDPDPPDIPTPTPDPDAARRHAAVESSGALVQLHEATVAAHPTLLALLAPFLADHRAHAQAIDPELAASPTPAAATSSSGVPASTASPSSSASATATPTGAGPTIPAVPPDPDAALAALAGAETAASASARADAVGAVEPALARLLASIAASRALHAYLLDAG